MKLEIEVLDESFSVCKLARGIGKRGVIEDAFMAGTFFFSATDKEISLVVPTRFAPAATEACENDYRALRIIGKLDFGLVGILAELTTLLAHEQIPVFAVSTFDTDYLFVKDGALARAVVALRNAGHTIVAPLLR